MTFDNSSKPQCASHDLNAIRQWECNHVVCVLTASRCMRYAMHKHQDQKSTPSMAPWVSHQHVQMSMHARDNQIGTPVHQAHNNQLDTQQRNMQPQLPHSPTHLVCKAMHTQLEHTCLCTRSVPTCLDSDSCRIASLHDICMTFERAN